MNWVLVVLSFLWPVVQPAVQQGVQNVQVRVQQRMQQQPPKAAESVPQYYFDGREWYCHCNGQWYVWRSN